MLSLALLLCAAPPQDVPAVDDPSEPPLQRPKSIRVEEPPLPEPESEPAAPPAPAPPPMPGRDSATPPPESRPADAPMRPLPPEPPPARDLREAKPATGLIVGLVGSTVVLGGGLVTGIIGQVGISSAEQDRDDAVATTANDDKPENDVQNFGDVCLEAATIPDPIEQPGAVKNASVYAACEQGRRASITAAVGWGITAAGAVGTLTFAVLLAVHKKRQRERYAAQHDLWVAPIVSAEGGGLSAGVRF